MMREESGFTLVELILVTVIISILAGMVSLSVVGRSKQARVSRALGDISTYETAIEAYALDHNDVYPDTLRELASGEKKYVRDLKRDPWGNPYVFIVPGEHHQDSFDVLSMGPDGTAGTEDDVVPWDEYEDEE